MNPSITILDAIADDELFGRRFRDRATWRPWFAFMAALFALPMTPDQLEVYRRCTHRTTVPIQPATEAWLVCGRRAGKSFILALCSVFIACFRDWSPYLTPGERALVMVIASDRRQAHIILHYIKALLTGVPMLARLIENQTKDGFEINGGISIEVHTASYRSTRGYTIVAALCDEIAFWPTDEAAEPDYEILTAIRPGMATIPGAMLLCASSPYARRGSLFDAYQKHFGRDNDPVLVWQASTRTMNPSVPQSFIDGEMERDAARAAAEYGAEFRRDVEALVAVEAVRACISPGVFERGPEYGITYYAFCDPSGGNADSMTLAIGHKNYRTSKTVIDVLREVRAPFSPHEVAAEFAILLKRYRVSKIVGDHYGGGWPVDGFAKLGIRYEPSAKSKSELYGDLVALINSKRIELLDNPKLVTQLCMLDRRTGRGGRDSIDHRHGAHDDVANAVAGVAIACIGKYGNFDPTYAAWQDDFVDLDRRREAEQKPPEQTERPSSIPRRSSH
jgi:hypothetical protein